MNMKDDDHVSPALRHPRVRDGLLRSCRRDSIPAEGDLAANGRSPRSQARFAWSTRDALGAPAVPASVRLRHAPVHRAQRSRTKADKTTNTRPRPRGAIREFRSVRADGEPAGTTHPSP